MKRNIVAVFVMLSVLLLSSCDTFVSSYHWRIVKSPLTGRYYEQTFMSEGFQQGLMGMSEVTQAEYDKYIAGGGK